MNFSRAVDRSCIKSMLSFLWVNSDMHCRHEVRSLRVGRWGKNCLCEQLESLDGAGDGSALGRQ